MNASSLPSSMLVMAMGSASAARVVAGPALLVPPRRGGLPAAALLDRAEALLEAVELGVTALGLVGVGRRGRRAGGDREQSGDSDLLEHAAERTVGRTLLSAGFLSVF